MPPFFNLVIMNIRHSLLGLFLPLSLFSCHTVEKEAVGRPLSSYVNPFVGASTNTELAGASHGLGKTFPGATAPFGMVQVSPNTITGGDNGPGYSYEHTTIEGFAFTQMSGIGWYGDLGNFLVMPTIGDLHTFAGTEDKPEEGYRSRYDKSTEKASAGYYSVFLSDYKIQAEATALPHSGMLRFTFPESKEARIQVDLARRVGGTSTLQSVEVVDDHTIKGWMQCTPDGGGWGNGDGKADYTVYFYAQFSKPFSGHGVWSADIPDDWGRKREDVCSERYREAIRQAAIHPSVSAFEGKHLGFYANFETKPDEVILLKSGISYTSLKNAEENLAAEMKDFDFDRTHAECVRLWNDELAKVSVEGGTDEEKRVFYTALYHTLIDPRLCSDINGEYTGADKKIHQTGKFRKRTIFSGWDVFRSQMPLQTIINPEMVNDLVNSLVEIADQSGNEYLERWELLNAYSGCMVGNPAISVLCDAYRKGIRDYDVEKAYRYALNTSRRFSNNDDGYTPGNISCTLEYDYTDWCMARLAEWLGKEGDRAHFDRRALSYATIFDPESGWFRPRNEKGVFSSLPEKGRLQEGYGCVESNPYQQGWFVPHDVEGMIRLMGGDKSFVSKLDSLFTMHLPAEFFAQTEDVTEEGLLGGYVHGNEPSHHIPFLYAWTSQPWKTQYWQREIMNKMYRNNIDGLCGNDDCGQMSAWYILSSMGFYPVCPGTDQYVLGAPYLPYMKVMLENGKTFEVKADKVSDKNRYVKSVKLNGKPYTKGFITQQDIMDGGTLTFEMTSSPNKKRVFNGTDRPYSLSSN